MADRQRKIPLNLGPLEAATAKVALQNYFIGAACNVKRWIRREVWKLQQAASARVGRAAGAATT